MIYNFDSTMPGGLTLSGSAGSLAAILQTYMVTGAGAGAVVTLNVAGGIATATYAAGHPFRTDAIAQYTGANPPSLNGLKRILSTTSNSVTFAAPGVPDGAATGSITSKLAPAGWNELHPGTANVFAAQPAVPEATGCVLRIDDTGTTNARVRAFETMSSISAGLGPTPLDSQVSGGLYWSKSGAADANARPWWLVADERGAYFAVDPQNTGRFTLFYFGDFKSLKSGDAYACTITGNQANQTAITSAPDGCCGWSHRGSRGGAYIVRLHTGVGGSIGAARRGAAHNGGTADLYSGAAGYSAADYPNGPNSGLLTTPVELWAGGLRGTLPGLHHIRNAVASEVGAGMIVDGTDDFLGRRLLLLRTAAPSAGSGLAMGTVVLDLSGPWSR